MNSRNDPRLAWFPYLLSGIDAERETMKHIRQLGLTEKPISGHSHQKAGGNSVRSSE